MTIYATVLDITPTRLWGLDSTRRLQRQLHEISKASSVELAAIQWLDDSSTLPDEGRVLLISGSFLFETRTLSGLLTQPDTILLHPVDQTVAAAFVDSSRVPEVLAYVTTGDGEIPAGLQTIQPDDMTAFDESLRRSTIPLLERISVSRKSELENTLYGNAYKGITDLVTKFLWPRPAKQIVRVCANTGITPNMVTTVGLLLVLAACYLFLNGQYAWGLLAGWLMTFLDTVDGKLARVTIKSSKFGHLYDHLTDLIHPPFWYIYWGMSLVGFQAVAGFDQNQMYWLIIAGYAGGRIVEGLFGLLGDCSIFTWRPYDAWFRLITARRNPCLILLTLSVLVGRPDWGFIAVTFWTVITTIMMVLRLLQGVVERVRRGPLSSWLSAGDVATGSHARTYAIFGATRGAYARQ